MCQGEQTHVVIAGAGPAGILLAINILRRNEHNGNKYKVTLVDSLADHGEYSDEDLKRHRSWMIGLSAHGLTAIRKIPRLFEDYVSQVGIKLEHNAIHIGTKQFKSSADVAGEGYIVDRNFICAAMARFLNANFGNSKSFTRMYDTKVLYVDGENQRLLTRSAADVSGNESYVKYDLLIGCDGVRSAVREAILKTHRDFACEVSDIFATFKAVHIVRPKSIDEAALHIMPAGMLNMNGIALPETGGRLNVSFGNTRNNVVDDALLSSDPKVVAAYVKKNFKAFELDDYDDFAQQWVGQKWSTTGQVHCNFYHSLQLNALILGDAAHATSPSIGMGMNTALSDVEALNELMDRHGDDFSKVLPAFSEERVKEGNALTYLAMHQYSMDQSQGLWMLMRSLARSFFGKHFPSLVMEEPLVSLGKGAKLSDVYRGMMELGRLQAVRTVNDGIMMDHFEKTTGMMKQAERPTWSKAMRVLVVGAAIASAVQAFRLLKRSKQLKL